MTNWSFCFNCHHADRKRQHSIPVGSTFTRRSTKRVHKNFSLVMYYTYVLYSVTLNQFYKGHCTNIRERFHRHNSGREIFTKKGVPWKLIWYCTKDSKSAAYQLELKLKNLTRSRLANFCLKYSDGIKGDDELKLLLQLSSCWPQASAFDSGRLHFYST